MKHSWQRLLTLESTVRIIADALLVNIALVLALVIRYLWLVGVAGDLVSPATTLQYYTRAYVGSFWLLTLISLFAFYFSGFYTYGRAYRGRYKVLIVAQAVSLSYVILIAISYFTRERLALPRGATLIAWGLTLGIFIGSRLFATLFKTVVKTEMRLYPSPSEEHDIERILVLGGAGYIGSTLLPKLLDKGYHVRLLDLLLYGTEPIQDILHHPCLEIVQADFRQVDTVVGAVRDIDAAIHLGAIVGDPACALDEELAIEVNLMATRMITEVIKGSGASRFIFASTCSVYGASDETLDERSTLKPVSLYARSKLASEQVAMSLAGQNFAPSILRFGTIYGLSGRMRFDLVINLLTAKAILDGQITVFGGDQWRPFLHVDDAAMAVVKVLEAPLTSVRNQIFNVGSDEQNYTIQQVAMIIHRLVPSAELVNMGTDTDRRNYRVDFSRIRRALGFMPQWTVEQGVQQIVEAVQNGRFADYRDARYSNVKFLREEGASRLIRLQNGWVPQPVSGPEPVLAIGDVE